MHSTSRPNGVPVETRTPITAFAGPDPVHLDDRHKKCRMVYRSSFILRQGGLHEIEHMARFLLSLHQSLIAGPDAPVNHAWGQRIALHNTRQQFNLRTASYQSRPEVLIDTPGSVLKTWYKTEELNPYCRCVKPVHQPFCQSCIKLANL
jgi:hypothetical protein